MLVKPLAGLVQVFPITHRGFQAGGSGLREPAVGDGHLVTGTCGAKTALTLCDDYPSNTRTGNSSHRIIRGSAASRIGGMGPTQPCSAAAAARAAGHSAVQRSRSASDNPPARKSGAAAFSFARHGLAGLFRASGLFRSGRAFTADRHASQAASRRETSADFPRSCQRRPIRRIAACANALSRPDG
jgi:hypothetical protein